MKFDWFCILLNNKIYKVKIGKFAISQWNWLSIFFFLVSLLQWLLSNCFIN